MRLIDVDRPEGSIHTARGQAKVSLVLVVILLGLTLFTMVIDLLPALHGRSSTLQSGVPQRLWTFTLIACALAMALSERYQRRKLEERVLALETQK